MASRKIICSAQTQLTCSDQWQTVQPVSSSVYHTSKELSGKSTYHSQVQREAIGVPHLKRVCTRDLLAAGLCGGGCSLLQAGNALVQGPVEAVLLLPARGTDREYNEALAADAMLWWAGQHKLLTVGKQ